MPRADHSAFAVALLPKLHKQSREGGPATFMTDLQGPNPFGFLLPASMNSCHCCPATPAQQEMRWEEGVRPFSLPAGLFSVEMCTQILSHQGRTCIWGSLLSVQLHLLFSCYRKTGWWLCHLWWYLKTWIRATNHPYLQWWWQRSHPTP